VVFLTQDTGLTIENLSIFGAFGWPGAHCNQHGVFYQKNAGIIAEGETNLTLTRINVYNTQGDLVDLQIPVDFGITGNPLNTNVVISNSHFDTGGGGFHGFGVESVGPTPTCPDCGLKLINTTWANNGTEWADFEVDDYPTHFTGTTGCTSLPGGLCPTYAAQDNVEIINNTMTGWCSPWFTSKQGAGQGVQEQNLTITGNRLFDSGCQSGGMGSFMDVTVHTPIGQPPQYWTSNWTIEHNTNVGGFVAVAGSSCGVSLSGFVTRISNTVNVTIEDNNFAVDYGQAGMGCPGNPYLSFMENVSSGDGNTNLTVKDNALPGAEAVTVSNPAGKNPGYRECGNTYGVAGTTTPSPGTDPPC
jgi:hypothetical protein